MYSDMPILPPASRPNDLEMIEYAPPAPILMLVVIEDIERPVQMVTVFAKRMMRTAPTNPVFPTTQVSLKYMITPRMVSTSGVNTPPKVPNLLSGVLFFVCFDFLVT